MQNEDLSKRALDESEETENSKRAKQSPAEDAPDQGDEIKDKEEQCIVCMEPNSEENPLLETHQCAQCKKDAWRVCVSCNETLLSRACPVCRGNYAPLNLYVIPGLPISQLADKTLAPDAMALLLYKFGIIRRLIQKTNVGVWIPAQAVMHLSLLQETEEGLEAACYLTVSLPLAPERVADGVFPITNSVWDEIENLVEHADDLNGVVRRAAEAAQWLLSFTRHSEHKILSMMTTADWENLLDPSTCEETAEAVQSILAGMAH